MNIAKHMEAVFVVAIAAVCSASYLGHSMPQAQVRPASAIVDSSIATETKVAVVVVKAKRPATLLADRGNRASRI